MPFQWLININKKPVPPPGIQFEPNPLSNVALDDQIVWANNDSVAHWPGLLNSDGTINKTFFMANQIAPQSSSDTFVVGASGTLKYVCSLHPGETGTIQITT